MQTLKESNMTTKKKTPVDTKDLKKQYDEGEVTRTEIDDTPFTVVTTKNGSFGILGKYRITEFYTDKEQCIQEVKKMTWNRILQVVSLVFTILNDEEK
jgi:hypothetical protein